MKANRRVGAMATVLACVAFAAAFAAAADDSGPVPDAVRDGRAVQGGVRAQPVLAIHGGAGVQRAGLSPEALASARAGLERALLAGHARLQAGAPALDAVVAAITVLEDDPSFNAGRGAVFTHDGRNELDASIMDGGDRSAGAVAGVQRVRNPILLARAVMDHSPHVMLVGTGAEAFAEGRGIELVDPAYFRTPHRWEQLQRALRDGGGDAGAPSEGDDGPQAEPGARQGSAPRGAKYFGTVGAVALDATGRLAAGTSTGGMTNKRWGRVGDAPIIGAGTWADERCAVSGTGWGEFYIRMAAAHEVCARVRHRGEGIATAAEAVINGDVVRAGGDGGAIALDADGQVAFPFNTEGMYRGWIGADGVPHVAVFADEALPLPAR